MIDLAALTRIAEDLASLPPEAKAIHVTNEFYDVMVREVRSTGTAFPMGLHVHVYDVNGLHALLTVDARRMNESAFRYFVDHPEALSAFNAETWKSRSR